VEIITADDDLVHVSGHGHAEEIKQMYNWTKPYISIPVHGEPMHLASHKKISEASQVPVTKILQNGKCLKIAPGDCSVVDNIDTGKLIVEGKFLYDSESDFIKDRRRYSYEGIAMISVLLNNDYSIDKNIQLSLIGLPVEELHFIKEEFKDEFVKNFTKLNDDQKSSDQNVIDIIRKSLKFVLKNILLKKPEIQIHLIRK
jgi:ribonuclease J